MKAFRFLKFRDHRTDAMKQQALLHSEEVAHQQALQVFRRRVAANIRRRIADGRYHPGKMP